jgi:hypothetical protein
MTEDDTTPAPDAAPDAPERRNPAENTAPPSNPEVEQDALEQGKEKLDRIVNW